MAFSDTKEGMGASFRTEARTHTWTDGGRTDRRGNRNSYLDVCIHSLPCDNTGSPCNSRILGEIKIRELQNRELQGPLNWLKLNVK